LGVVGAGQVGDAGNPQDLVSRQRRNQVDRVAGAVVDDRGIDGDVGLTGIDAGREQVPLFGEPHQLQDVDQRNGGVGRYRHLVGAELGAELVEQRHPDADHGLGAHVVEPHVGAVLGVVGQAGQVQGVLALGQHRHRRHVLAEGALQGVVVGPRHDHRGGAVTALVGDTQ